MKMKKGTFNILQEARYKFWDLMALRCKHCPFAGSDWSDYHDTGYIGPKCELHPKNECDGCITPWIVIGIKYQKYKKDQLAAYKAEEEFYNWEREHEDEIHKFIQEAEDAYYERSN